MRITTVVTFSQTEILQILTDIYNKEKGTKHIFALDKEASIGEIVRLNLVKWDKDEKTH